MWSARINLHRNAIYKLAIFVALHFFLYNKMHVIYKIITDGQERKAILYKL